MTLPVKMGSEDARSDRERWIDWAAHSEWRFQSYYKYSFVFTAEGALLSLPGGPQVPITATVSAGGTADDSYRYEVTGASMTWDEVTAAGGWLLTVATVSGAALFSARAESS